MEERRATSRQRVFKVGTIEFDGGGIDCTIRNISPVGAALDVACPIGIPHEIMLNIVTRQQRQHCYVIWRKETRIGVVFDRGKGADLSPRPSSLSPQPPCVRGQPLPVALPVRSAPAARPAAQRIPRPEKEAIFPCSETILKQRMAILWRRSNVGRLS
jgi:hypothetical protein